MKAMITYNGLQVSSFFELVFHPVNKSKYLPDQTRVLIKNSKGYLVFAVYFKDDGFYDECDICYAGGLDGKINGIKEFCVNFKDLL